MDETQEETLIHDYLETSLEDLQEEIELLREVLFSAEEEFGFPLHSRDWKPIRDAVRVYRLKYPKEKE